MNLKIERLQPIIPLMHWASILQTNLSQSTKTPKTSTMNYLKCCESTKRNHLVLNGKNHVLVCPVISSKNSGTVRSWPWKMQLPKMVAFSNCLHTKSGLLLWSSDLKWIRNGWFSSRYRIADQVSWKTGIGANPWMRTVTPEKFGSDTITWNRNPSNQRGIKPREKKLPNTAWIEYFLF